MDDGEIDVQGIIPARAGSRSTRGTEGPETRDHPRACGEQDCVAALAVLIPRSSPRVRGAEGYRATVD